MFGISTKAVFGIALILIALLLAVVMTIVNVAKSESASERKYVISSCAFSWLLIAGAMVLVMVVPRPYDYIPLGAILFIFPASIYRMSLRHQLLRERERRHTERLDREEAET